MRKLDFFNEESSFQSGPPQAKYRATQCVINVSIIYFLFVAPPHHQKCGQSQGETLMSSLFRPYMCLHPCININKISFIGKKINNNSDHKLFLCPLLSFKDYTVEDEEDDDMDEGDLLVSSPNISDSSERDASPEARSQKRHCQSRSPKRTSSLALSGRAHIRGKNCSTQTPTK